MVPDTIIGRFEKMIIARKRKDSPHAGMRELETTIFVVIDSVENRHKEKTAQNGGDEVNRNLKSIPEFGNHKPAHQTNEPRIPAGHPADENGTHESNDSSTPEAAQKVFAFPIIEIVRRSDPRCGVDYKLEYQI